jgi:C_GCAxxG_C_C family probable redox protein
MIDVKKLRQQAESYYRTGDFYCSEAIVKTIKDTFCPQAPDVVIALASGFPVGIGGARCICGAVAGGTLALGLLFGRTEAKSEKVNKAMQLSKELHDLFANKHNCLCCRVHTRDMELGSPKHMDQCISFTGEVAEETAKIIKRELNL